MKKLIAVLAFVASFAALSPATVQARDTHGYSSHSSSQKGYYKTVYVRVRVVVGHRHGHAIYGWRTVKRHVFVKSSQRHGSSHGSSYNHNGSSSHGSSYGSHNSGSHGSHR